MRRCRRSLRARHPLVGKSRFSNRVTPTFASIGAGANFPRLLASLLRLRRTSALSKGSYGLSSLRFICSGSSSSDIADAQHTLPALHKAVPVKMGDGKLAPGLHAEKMELDWSPILRSTLRTETGSGTVNRRVAQGDGLLPYHRGALNERGSAPLGPLVWLPPSGHRGDSRVWCPTNRDVCMRVYVREHEKNAICAESEQRAGLLGNCWVKWTPPFTRPKRLHRRSQHSKLSRDCSMFSFI